MYLLTVAGLILVHIPGDGDSITANKTNGKRAVMMAPKLIKLTVGEL